MTVAIEAARFSAATARVTWAAERAAATMRLAQRTHRLAAEVRSRHDEVSRTASRTVAEARRCRQEARELRT